MYFKIGNTKIIAGKFSLDNVDQIEINFEYIFASNNSYRRFVNVVSDSQYKNIKINIKSKFTEFSDCDKLAQLLTGISNFMNQDNIALIDQILEGKSKISIDDFVAAQQELTPYFL